MKRIKFLSLLAILLLVITGCGNNKELSKNTNKETINNNESVESTKIEDKSIKCSAVIEYDENDCNLKEEVDIIFNFKNDDIVDTTYYVKDTVLSEYCYYDDKNLALAQEMCLDEENYSDKCEIELVSDKILTITGYRKIQKNEKTLFGFDIDMTKYNNYEELYNFLNEDTKYDESELEDKVIYNFTCE